MQAIKKLEQDINFCVSDPKNRMRGSFGNVPAIVLILCCVSTAVRLLLS